MARRTGLLLLALVVAMMGTGAVFLYVSKADSRALADQKPVSILVAKKTIPAGTSAQQASEGGMLRLAQQARAAVPEDALSDITDVKDLVVVSDVFPGEVLLRPKFVANGSVGALPIPTDKMAVSVELNDPQRVAGFVQPGSEVAIFDTFEVDSADVTATVTGARSVNVRGAKVDRATRLLLPRASVIAVGPVSLRPSSGEDKDDDSTVTDDKPVTTAVLTVAVSATDAEKLVHAAQTGEVYFALLTSRSKTGPTQGVDNSTLFR